MFTTTTVGAHRGAGSGACGANFGRDPLHRLRRAPRVASRGSRSPDCFIKFFATGANVVNKSQGRHGRLAVPLAFPAAPRQHCRRARRPPRRRQLGRNLLQQLGDSVSPLLPEFELATVSSGRRSLQQQTSSTDPGQSILKTTRGLPVRASLSCFPRDRDVLTRGGALQPRGLLNEHQLF